MTKQTKKTIIEFKQNEIIQRLDLQEFLSQIRTPKQNTSKEIRSMKNVMKSVVLAVFMVISMGICHGETLNPKMSYSLEDLANNEHTYPYQPVYQPWTKNAITLYSKAWDAKGQIPVITMYVVGETTTVATVNKFQVFDSSIEFTQAGGLREGTTWWEFLDHPTITEGVNYMVNIGTSVPGIWGGLVISTIAPQYGAWQATRLKQMVSSENYKSYDGRKTLYVTTTSADAVTYGVFASSFELRSAGLTSGATSWALQDYKIGQLVDIINNLNAYALGVEGGMVAEAFSGTYLDDYLNTLTKINLTGIRTVANKKTITKDDTMGMSYVLPVSSLTSTQQFRLTDASVNATFGSGTCYVRIYDGAYSTNTIIRNEKISTSAYDAKLDIGESGDFCGSVYTPLRFDVYNSTSMTAGWINLDCHKR